MGGQQRCSTAQHKIYKLLLFPNCLTESTELSAWKHWHNRDILMCRSTAELSTAAKSVVVTTTHFWPGLCSWPGINKPDFLFSLDDFKRKGEMFQETGLIHCWPRVFRVLHSFILGFFLMCGFTVKIWGIIHTHNCSHQYIFGRLNNKGKNLVNTKHYFCASF